MRFPRHLLGLLLLLLPLVADADRRKPWVADFFALPTIAMVSISPTGDWIVGVAQHEDSWGVLVQRRGTLESDSVYRSAHTIVDVQWIGPDTLFVDHDDDAVNAAVLQLRLDEGIVEHEALKIRRKGSLVAALPEANEVVLWAEFNWKRTRVRRGPVSALAIGKGRRSPRWVQGELKDAGKVKGSVTYLVADRTGVLRAALVLEGDRGETRSLRYRSSDGSRWREAWSGPTDGDESIIPLALTRDGKRLIVAAYGEHDTMGLHEFDPEAESLVREIFRHPEVDVYNALFDYDGVEIIAAAYREAGTRKFFYRREYREQHLPDTASLGLGESVSIVSSSRGHRYFALHSAGPREPGTFYFLDAATGELQRLGSVNDAMDPADLVDVVALQVRSSDGTELEAFLALPERADGRPSPLVVVPHGGPIGVQDDRSFDPLVQYLASAGLAVLEVNYRGSGGYGRAFLEAGAKEFGRAIEDDVEAAVQLVVSKGLVDPDRLCIVGGSYGGYSALMSTIRRPERYRCAATLNGVTDLPLRIANYPEFRDYHDKFVGDAEAEFDRLIEVSPVYQTEELRVPVLVMHGGRDQNVDPDHAFRLRAMLEAHGKDFEWLLVPEMDHSPTPKEWTLVARGLRWFVRCHLGEIRNVDVETWRGRRCAPGPRPAPAESPDTARTH